MKPLSFQALLAHCSALLSTSPLQRDQRHGSIFTSDTYVNGAHIRSLLITLRCLYSAAWEEGCPFAVAPPSHCIVAMAREEEGLICINDLMGTGVIPPPIRYAVMVAMTSAS